MSLKLQARKMIEEAIIEPKILERGETIDFYIKDKLVQLTSGFDTYDNDVNYWFKNYAPSMLRDNHRIIRPPSAKFKETVLFRQLLKFIKELDDEDLKVCEMTLMGSWYTDSENGVSRSSWEWGMYLARALLPFLAEQQNPVISVVPSIPSGLFHGPIRDGIIRNPSASTGYPDWTKWSRLSEEDRNNIWNDSEQTVRDIGYIIAPNSHLDHKQTLANLDTYAEAQRYYLAGFTRNQGLGRFLTGVPKRLLFIVMDLTQRISRRMERLSWNWIGDRLQKVIKAKLFWSLPPGATLVDGDDGVLKCLDGVLCLDASAFDTGVFEEELKIWLSMLKRILPRSVYYVYYTYFRAMMLAPILTNIGIIKWPSWAAVRSGCPETHILDLFVEQMRELNAYKNSDGTMDSVIRELSKFGEYRPNKQFKFQQSFTISQQYWTALNPDIVHGLMARIGRSLVQAEDWYRGSHDASDIDAVVIQKLSALYGHPKFEEFTTWFFEQGYEIRSSSHEIGKALGKLYRRTQSFKGTEMGIIENKALQSVLTIAATI